VFCVGMEGISEKSRFLPCFYCFPYNKTVIDEREMCLEIFVGKNKHRNVCFHRLLRPVTDYSEESAVRQELDAVFNKVTGK